MNFDDLFPKTQPTSTMDTTEGYNQARKFPYTRPPVEQKPLVPSKKFRYQDALTFNPDQKQQQHFQSQLTTKNNLGRGYKGNSKDFSPLSWFRRHPKVIMVTSYIAVLIIGATCGFVPFIKVYIDECKADRQALTDWIENAKTFDTAPVHRPADYLLGSKATEQLGVNLKKGSAPSTEQIELSCEGDIIILHMTHKGVKSDKKTLRDSQNYCDKHVYQRKDSQNICFVSLPKVYNTKNEYYEGAITEIFYTCL